MSRDCEVINYLIVVAAHASKTRSVAELFTAADNSGQKSDKEAQQVLLLSLQMTVEFRDSIQLIPTC